MRYLCSGSLKYISLCDTFDSDDRGLRIADEGGVMWCGCGVVCVCVCVCVVRARASARVSVFSFYKEEPEKRG